MHVHGAGPRTFANIAYKMVVDEGFEGPVSYPDLVRKTHTRKDGTFIDERAEALVLEVEKAVEEMLQEGSPGGDSQTDSTAGTTTSKRLLLTQEYIKQPVDLGGRAGSVMDLGFYGSYFCRSLGDIVAKITYIRRLASRFPCLSAFTASELGLLFSQLFLFIPIEDFLLFCHWFVERRAFPSESASGPPWMSVDVLISIVGDIARIQVDLFDSVVLRSLRGRRRAFRVSLFDGRFFARVLTQRSFLRGSRPVEWGCEVESFPVDFSGSAGADFSSPCR
ncbi:hypothetical protein F2Q69_00014642 [Brassica cretica]|uniref:Uncharacterized protein n=1 Tax=Brassica cretica TaxID=69181 RepID=A0A8S9R312_BRACR|nr:hypothetical protein F2Q69_00014642 [Brassica cretica]